MFVAMALADIWNTDGPWSRVQVPWENIYFTPAGVDQKKVHGKDSKQGKDG